jgi:hypothetical protein
MEEFYIDVEISRGLTRIQVDEVPPEQWHLSYVPEFVIEYHTGKEFLTLTIQLEHNIWYDRNTRLSDGDFNLRYFELGPDEAWNPDYQSPLNTFDLKVIGGAISNYMVIHLTTYMGLFIPQFVDPAKN